jgi:hypothetical protein
LDGGWTTTEDVDVEVCWTQGFSMGGGESALSQPRSREEAESAIWEGTHHKCQHNAIPNTLIRKEDVE